MKSVAHLLALGALLTGGGCHRDPASEAPAAGESGHEHHAMEPPGGVAYTSGKGLTVNEAIRKQEGWEAVAVTSRTLSDRVEFPVQVIAPGDLTDHWRASGTVPRAQLADVKIGHAVVLRGDAGATLAGHVRTLDESLSRLHGEVEVVVELNGPPPLPWVPFWRATISGATARDALVVPTTAVLRTVEGTLVYVLNGDVCRRTTVRLGTESDGVLEITAGLRPGEAVVAGSVEALYLVELRAMQGGEHGHSH